jgi:hypothetical protein
MRRRQFEDAEGREKELGLIAEKKNVRREEM